MHSSISRALICALLFLIFSLCAMSQTFKTQAPASTGQQESFRVQYVISTDDVSEFHCPSSADFEILAGPSTSTFSSTQWVNGKHSSSSSITYTYILQARRTGRLALPRPTVKAGGRTLQATAATINVTSGGTPSATPRSSSSTSDEEHLRTARSVTQRDLFVRCITSKTNLYEQEPVSVTYKVYARAGVALSNVLPHNKPEMKGFWTQEVELPSNLQPSFETIGGATYRVYTFMQYVAFPQQSGTLTLPPLITECSVLQNDPHIDPLDAFFNGGGTLSSKVTRSTDGVSFNVRPLPVPRPAGFSGGVGTLTAEGKLLTPAPATNDIATYRITVSGQGNMKLIQAPAVIFPKSFDTFDPKTEDATRLTYGNISGKITFDYTFVPREEGDFTIPATKFIYFDIASGAYRTVNIPATQLHVKKGQRSREDVERELALRQSTIRPDHTQATRSHTLTYPLYLLLLLLFAALAWLAGLMLRMPIARQLRTRWQQSSHQRNKHLAAAEEALHQRNARAFYAALEQAFQAAATPPEQAEEILSRRFAPDAASPENLKQAMNDARRLLITFLFLILPTFSTLTAASALPTLSTLPTLTAASALTADSCYNAGNEAYRLKENAKAVLAYSRALWHDPGHEDARYNLALVQTHLEDRFNTPQEMFFTTWLRSLRTSRSYSSWLAIALLLFIALLASIVTFRHCVNKYIRRAAFYLGIAALLLFLTVNVFALRQHRDRRLNNQAVITADEAPCYDSPVARTKPALTLHAGTLVNITSSYGKDWTEVRLPDGHSVWIQKKALETVAQ